MANEDHLDKETSVSAEITPTGVTAKAKSRFIAAIDRLGGNIVELVNARMEGGVSRRRSIIDGERRIIEAAVHHGIEKMGKDEAFVERALQNHFKSLFVKQDNRDEVLRHAIEDLRLTPPSESETIAGPESLDEEFMNRIEGFANQASSEAAREKWGRVLAAEIRKPGTITNRTLRVIDELDPTTAQVFEKFSASILNNTLPKALVGDLPFNSRTSLTEADLLVDPGLTGQILNPSDAEIWSKKVWVFRFEDYCIAIPQNAQRKESDVVSWEDNIPKIPVYVLTDVGRAVASILPRNEAQTLVRLAKRVSEGFDEGTEILAFNIREGGRIIPIT